VLLAAKVQRIALVVSERISRREGARPINRRRCSRGQAPVDSNSEIDLGAIAETGRVERQLPTVDSRGCTSTGKKDVSYSGCCDRRSWCASQKVSASRIQPLKEYDSELMFLVRSPCSEPKSSPWLIWISVSAGPDNVPRGGA